MSVPVPKRNDSPAEFLNKAGEIDRVVVSLTRKKYYEDVKDTILKSMYEYSSAMLSCLVRADDLYATEQKSGAVNELLTLPMVQERFRRFSETAQGARSFAGGRPFQSAVGGGKSREAKGRHASRMERIPEGEARGSS